MLEFIGSKTPSKSEKKKFIVLFGSGIKDEKYTNELLKKEFKINLTNAVEINPENIIENNTDFKKDIEVYKKEFKKYESEEEIPNDFLMKCGAVYNKYKIEVDKFVSDLMSYLVENGYDIIYKTPGNDMEWFLKHDVPIVKNSENKYEIEIVYFAIEEDEIVKRAFEHAKESGRMESKQVIYDIARNAERNFMILADYHDFSLYLADDMKKIPKIVFRKKTLMAKLKLYAKLKILIY